MVSSKETLFRTLQGNTPGRFVNGWEPFATVRNDPIMTYLRSNRKRGCETVDRWGTHISWPEDQPAATPHITNENKVLKDISRWREVVFPNLMENCTDWAAAQASAAEVDRSERLVTAFMGTGIFEQAHFLMGIEDTLCNLLLEPEHMRHFLHALLEYRLTYAKMLVENLKPDAILSHDDWGEKQRLFMRPEVWREFFKPLYAELYGYMKRNGVLVIHHADSFCEPIVEDMADIGIDIWQGCLPQNNIPAIQKRLAGRMTLMGGIDTAKIDVAGWNEEDIRTETRRACREYGPGGYFIPCHTYGLNGTIYPEVYDIARDEIDRCSSLYF